ncbi:MAG: HPr family phosphocarrier protein [Propionibacteriaceae bacterium]|jgi:phosphocarrier protein|nr:HPr family phosphocarrier protein [Propionibacteriaceae bacterium]
MQSFTYVVKDRAGIHARPAGLLVKTMQGFECPVTITCHGKTIDGKKLFALMAMAVRCGDAVTLTTDGVDEEEAMASAREFITANL